ncbi:MAG: hypothetical protein ACYC9K_00985 [Sulfuricaulis sp.]
MKWLLSATLMFAVLTVWTAYFAPRGRSGDEDIARAVAAALLSVISVVMVFVYLLLAFWNHRWW